MSWFSSLILLSLKNAMVKELRGKIITKTQQDHVCCPGGDNVHLLNTSTLATAVEKPPKKYFQHINYLISANPTPPEGESGKHHACGNSTKRARVQEGFGQHLQVHGLLLGVVLHRAGNSTSVIPVRLFQLIIFYNTLILSKMR